MKKSLSDTNFKVLNKINGNAGKINGLFTILRNEWTEYNEIFCLVYLFFLVVKD